MNKAKYENEYYQVDNGDYLNLVTKTSTKEQRKKFNIGDIYINAAVCLKCHSYIRSTHGHDFKFCACEAIAVDGGSFYCRRVGEPQDMINIIENFIK